MKKTENNNEKDINERKISNPQKNLILLIGISIFSWEGIGSFAFLLKRIVKDILLNIGVKPYLIEWSALLTNFIISIIGIIILAKIIIINKFSYFKIFIVSLLFLLMVLVLQFFEPIINYKFRTNIYLINSNHYYDFLSEHPNYSLISFFLQILLWLLIATIIFLKRKNN